MLKLLRLLGRWLLLLGLAVLALQLYWAGRILLMNGMDPGSTSFQRSEILRILKTKGELPWRQDWQDIWMTELKR